VGEDWWRCRTAKLDEIKHCLIRGIRLPHALQSTTAAFLLPIRFRPSTSTPMLLLDD
jgi:hypothetical protein